MVIYYNLIAFVSHLCFVLNELHMTIRNWFRDSFIYGVVPWCGLWIIYRPKKNIWKTTIHRNRIIVFLNGKNSSRDILFYWKSIFCFSLKTLLSPFVMAFFIQIVILGYFIKTTKTFCKIDAKIICRLFRFAIFRRRDEEKEKKKIKIK